MAAAAAMAISPAIAAAAPSPAVDDTVAQFGSGTPVAGTSIVEPGEVRLKPIVATNFDGATPLAGWTTGLWESDGTAAVEGGMIALDAARISGPSMTEPSVAMEFRATFASADFQHIGFGDNFDAGPWAMFSTGDDNMSPGIYARTRTGTGTQSTDTLITGVTPGAHTYRIELSGGLAKFYVDGALKPTPQATPITTPMRAVASDLRNVRVEPVAGAAVLNVDSIGAYPTSGTFQSRLHAADDARAVWGNLTHRGTGVDFETRTGNTATPDDGSWSAFQPLTGDAIKSPPGRNIQYRVALTTSDAISPMLDSVSMTFAIDDTAPTAAIDGVDVSGTTAALRFSSPSNDVARLECSLDGAGFAACTSPKQFTGLSAGAHTASVRGVDKLGNTGEAVSQGFTIAAGAGGVLSANTPDTLAPKVTIAPRSVRASRRGIVRLGVTCPVGELSCKVDLKLKRAGKTVARKLAMVGGGETLELKLTLKQAARLKLTERGKLNVTAVAKTEDASGNSTKVKRGITLRPHSS